MDGMGNTQIQESRPEDEAQEQECATDFERIAERAIARRGFLGGVVAFGASAFVAGVGTLAPKSASAKVAWLDFEPVAANSLDTVTVPKGFQWHRVISWGDPLWSSGVAFDQATRGSGASQEKAFGDNNDGMSLFSINGRSVLAVNNEYVNNRIFFGNRPGGKPENSDDTRKAKAAHGVSIVEIEQNGQYWRVVKDSPFNRKITADTPMEITGPARGHDWMKTAADPNGAVALGTWNNCGNGETPWGTYLTCEENFNGYFSTGDVMTTSGPPRSSATASRRRTAVTTGRNTTSVSISPGTRTNPTGSAISSKSIPPIRTRRRRSGPRWDASSTRTPSW